MSFFIVQQLPVLPPSAALRECPWATSQKLGKWIIERVVSLTATSWDMMPFARKFSNLAEPVVWNDEERLQNMCELDAAFFHLYLGQPSEWNAEPTELLQHFPTPRHAVEHIMETFPVVSQRDSKKYGTYRTKETILSIYDAMQHAIDTGEPYQTLLDPPPADPRVAHHE